MKDKITARLKAKKKLQNLDIKAINYQWLQHWEQLQPLELKEATNILSYNALSDEIDISTIFIGLDIQLYTIDIHGHISLDNQIISELPYFDYIFLPGLTFNHAGYRLGRGGGFYDRLFTKKHFNASYKIGIIPDELLIEDTFAIDHWDIPVNMIMTEKVVWHPLAQ